MIHIQQLIENINIIIRDFYTSCASGCSIRICRLTEGKSQIFIIYWYTIKNIIIVDPELVMVVK